MPGQEFAALHQGYRMGMYLGDVLYVVVREAKQAVGNAQLMLAYDGKSTVAKQLVIVQQAARYGILDGSHTEYRTVVLYRGKYFFKGGAADKFYVLFVEEVVGGHVVVRPFDTLDCNSFHCFCFVVFTKKSRFGGKRDLMSYWISIILCLVHIRTPASLYG